MATRAKRIEENCILGREERVGWFCLRLEEEEEVERAEEKIC